MKTIIAVLALSSSFSFAAETTPNDTKPVTAVEVRIESGKIKITGAEGTTATSSVEKETWSDKCETTTENKNGKLTIIAKKKGDTSTITCKSNVTVTAPKNVNITVANGAGDLEITGTTGGVSYKLGFGDVTINAEVNKLEGKSGKGFATVNGLTGGAQLKNGYGDFKVTYKTAPTKGQLEMATGKGSAEVMMPATAKIKTEFKAGMGDKQNELGDSKDAPFKIMFKTGMGDLNIKKLQ